MATTYRLDATAAQIARDLGADAGDDVWEGGGVQPGSYAPVVIGGNGRSRHLAPRQWGVPPPPRGSAPVTTVRNLASPFWIGTLRHTQFRCLIPMTGIGMTGARNNVRIDVPATPIFACAGIWRDSEVPSFAMLTTEANTAFAKQGMRGMPVILHPDDYARWLTASWKDAQCLVRPFPAHAMRVLN